MVQCKVCGNSKITDSETICSVCGTEIALSETPSVSSATAISPEARTVDASPINSSAPSPPSVSSLVASATGGAGLGWASLTVIRGGGLTNEKLTWTGNLVVVGKFDVDEGPVDVDLSQIPEAGYVSRRHCQIRSDSSGQWFVKDLGSSNGTFLRPAGEHRFSKALGEQGLKDGDEIALGNARFVFHVEANHA